jgi:5'-nucleotidase
MAQYKFVSSNLDGLAGVLDNVVTPFHMVTVAGVKVAVVGISNPELAQLTSPANLGPITVKEPVAAATLAAKMARTAGADVVIVIAHLGATALDASKQPTGPLLDFASKVSSVDLILGDHTDFAVNTVVNGVHVIENRSFGRTYARVKLTFDPMPRMVTATTVDIVSPDGCTSPDADAGCTPAITPDPQLQQLVAGYQAQVAAVLDGKIGVTSGIYNRGANVERLGEVALGDLVADSLRDRYGTQLAITNGGGLRKPIPSDYMPADKTLMRPATGYAAGPPWDVVAGDAYAVLPFGNVAVTRTVTGQQLWAALEQSVGSEPAAYGGFLQISGFSFTYSLSATPRVQSVTLAAGGAIAKDATTYTLTLPDFTNAGGDGYALFNDGSGMSRDKMADVLRDYIKAHTPLTPATSNRITQLP